VFVRAKTIHVLDRATKRLASTDINKPQMLEMYRKQASKPTALTGDARRRFYVFSFMSYLTMLSVAQSVQHRMIRLLMNAELEMMLKETVSTHYPGIAV
jgi:hypothetical protein